jgi:endoribonuclease LACTB2
MDQNTNEIIPITNGLGVVPVRSPTLPPATHTNVWVLGDHHVTIVDPASPFPDEQQRLDEILEMVMVERIVLTHHHADHVGGALAIQKTTGAKIAAHPLTQERLDFTVDELLEDGDVVATDAGFWKVLHTPGHAQGHICLRNAGLGSIIAGDMVAGVGTILIDPPEGNLAQYLGSLSRLRDLHPRLLMPAHGPVIENAVEYLTEYIDHRHMRTQQIVAHLHAIPGSSADDLAQAIYAELVPVSFLPVAARQILAHLEWLEGDGQVKTNGNGYHLTQS